MANGQLERIHFMDSMRSILMMLGVVLHSSRVFEAKQEWIIYSQNTSIIANDIGPSIHIFRMPAFFIVAGFFCVLTISKYKPQKFLAIRLKRIIIPLVVTAITLNSLQTAILIDTGFLKLDLGEYIFLGGWVSHLWFLNNLIIYFLLAASLATFLSWPTGIVGKFLDRLFSTVPIVLIIFMMPIASIMILGLNKVGFPLYDDIFGVFRVNIILKYLPYFAFGAVLGGNKELLFKFSTINPIFALFVIIGSNLTIKSLSFQNEMIQKGIIVYFEILITWFTVSLCFYIFYRFFNTQSKKWQFLSDASYTVYLFHHVIVIGIGYLLMHLEIHPLVNVLILILLTLSITLCIHKYFILKSRYARFLFNGK